MQDGRFVRYCSGSTEHPVVQQYVADYAEKILQSVKTTDLLFQTSNEAAAAWCYRVPEQLVRCVSLSSMPAMNACMVLSYCVTNFVACSGCRGVFGGRI